MSFKYQSQFLETLFILNSKHILSFDITYYLQKAVQSIVLFQNSEAE